jgi:hypothetical protein
MKINIKTQTSRSTHYREGFNCINLFLSDIHGNSGFEIGLRTREWGSNKDLPMPVINIGIKGRDYDIPLDHFIHFFSTNCMKMGQIITKQWLHQIEMELARLCDSGEITREDVISRFTNLIYVAPDEK